jgi:hypothetical protein
MAERKLTPFEKKLRQEKREAAKIAKTLLPELEKDRDWVLVTDKGPCGDYGLFRKARTRLTKKAIKLLIPDAVKISVRAGKGTAWSWVDVEVTLSEELTRGSNYEIRRRIEDVLVALNIQYGQYLPDSLPGRDEYCPCLSVGVWP